MEFISKSLVETKKVAIDFIKNLKPHKERATIVGLYGELGSGKTTFMKYLAESLGVKETIQSPTFVIMKKFLIPNSRFKYLIHIDAYRLDGEEDLLKLGWQEMAADPDHLICIEWLDRVVGILPKHTMIKFEHLSDTERKIEIKNGS